MDLETINMSIPVLTRNCHFTLKFLEFLYNNNFDFNSYFGDLDDLLEKNTKYDYLFKYVTPIALLFIEERIFDDNYPKDEFQKYCSRYSLVKKYNRTDLVNMYTQLLKKTL